MSVGSIFATYAAIAGHAVPGDGAPLDRMSILPDMARRGVPGSWPTFPTDAVTGAAPTGLLIGPIGLPLFGIVAAIVLVMVFASSLGTSARSRGSSSRLGPVVGLMVLVLVTLVIIAVAR